MPHVERVHVLSNADDANACARNLCAAAVALARRIQADGNDRGTVARVVRQIVDLALDDELGPTLTRDEMPRADRAVLDALGRFELRPGEPFLTRRVDIAAAANVRAFTIDFALARLERDGVIRREGKPGRGTTVTIIRRAA